MQLSIDMQTATAFLHVQMMTTAIYGVPIAPAALADEKGNAVVVQQVASSHSLEHLLRPVSCLTPCFTQSLSHSIPISLPSSQHLTRPFVLPSSAHQYPYLHRSSLCAYQVCVIRPAVRTSSAGE